MNQQENLKAHVIGMCVKGKMTVKEGAKRLELSERQVKNLKARYREFGVSSMLHGNCGRQPVHALTPEVKQRILAIKGESEYENINFTHFQEDLAIEFGIQISYSALRNLLLKNGLKSPKTRRKGKVKHPRRERRKRLGELLQTDATPFKWLGDGQKYALHGAIDDATGQVTGLYMTQNECAEGYFRILKQTIQNFGVPLAIYADGLSLFFGRGKPTVEEQLLGKAYSETQFESILKQLGTSLIHARSPQAKGRVERLWETLQSRLPVEFAKRKIKTTEAANKFLEEYITIFNERFGVAPASEASAFMARPKGLNLDNLLSIRYERTVDNSGCFSLHNIICCCNIPNIRPKTKIVILVNERIGVRILHEGHLYRPTPILDKNKKQVAGSSVCAILAKFIYESCLKNEHAA